jgi:DUF218 domain
VAALLLAVILCILWFIRSAGKILVVDAPVPSDVIVVLAGETSHRPERAVELLNQGLAPRLIIDVPAQARIYEFSQVDLAKQYIHDTPRSSSMNVCPIQGLSTRDESHDVRKCLEQISGSRILIVTSDFHTRRALNIFRHELRDKSFSIAAARDETQFGARWWTHRQWAKTFLDEWLRLLWWSAVERWQQRGNS